MIIYKATNLINGKGYIGLSQQTLDKRREKHYNDAKYGPCYYFQRALRKYKKRDWEWIILDTCNTKEEAGILEQKYIAEYGTFGGGYNLTTGGESGWEIGEETRKKLSESHIGVSNGPHSAETKRKIGAAHKGKKVEHTAETREKMSMTAKNLTPVTCPHCDKSGKKSVMVRWHFDNCKWKKDE